MAQLKHLKGPSCANSSCDKEICRVAYYQDYVTMTCSCLVDPLISGNCIKITRLG